MVVRRWRQQRLRLIYPLHCVVRLYVPESLAACFVCPRASITTGGSDAAAWLTIERRFFSSLISTQWSTTLGATTTTIHLPSPKKKRISFFFFDFILFSDSTQAAMNWRGISHRFPIAAYRNSNKFLFFLCHNQHKMSFFLYSSFFLPPI